jgi:chromatin assembly factor 1 subunit B
MTNVYCRSGDGLTLVISSSDGFCSTLSFAHGELGDIYKGEVGPPKVQAAPATASSTQNTPTATPTTSFAPPSPFPGGSHHQHRNSASSITAGSPPASTPFVPQRPSSPTRSNSTSSVATQSSSAHPGVVTNPPLISGSVPSIAATNSGKVTGVPLTTPPETPRATTGGAGTKREAGDGDREESKEPKKRRIAPTLVSSDSK